VIAILRDDIDPGVPERRRDRAELPRLILFQSTHQHFPYRDYAKALRVSGSAGALAVLDEEMRMCFIADGKNATAFKAYASCSEGAPEPGQIPGRIIQQDMEILHEPGFR
jgi:hypothetical protein